MSARLERSASSPRTRARWGDEQIDARCCASRDPGGGACRVPRVDVSGLLLVVGLGTMLGIHRSPSPASLVESRVPLRLDAGTTAVPLTRDAQIVTAEVTPQAATVRLPGGAARFKVKKGRKFRVDAGAVQIDVLGTEFDVVHAGADRVSVVVSHGRVRVGWKGGETVLEAGQRGHLPAEEVELPTEALTPEPVPQPEPDRIRRHLSRPATQGAGGGRARTSSPRPRPTGAPCRARDRLWRPT